MEDLLIGHGVRVNGRDYRIVGATGGDVYSAGGPTVFEVFDSIPYTFLTIQSGGVTGNTIVAQYEATGIFKMRTGMVQNDSSENVEQGATLHVRPTEAFLTDVPANREHYRLTLVETDWSDFEAES